MAGKNSVVQIVVNGVNNAAPMLKQLGGQFGSLGSLFSVTSVAIAAAGVAVVGTIRKLSQAYSEAVTAAGEFEKAVLEVNTLLNATPQQVGRLNRQLMDLSVEFGQVAEIMAKAEYNVVSAGFGDISESVDILTVANKAAIGGVTDVNTAAKLLTQTLNAYGEGSERAEYYAGVLFTTIKGGVTTFPELAQHLGKVTATAATAGISFEEVAGAIAAMTKKGIDTAEATTALNSLLVAIGASSGESKDKLDALGITLDNGLAEALIAVDRAGGESLAMLKEMIPNIRALKAAASLGAEGAAELNSQLATMADGVENFNEAYRIMSESFDQAVKRNAASQDRLKKAIGATGLEGQRNILLGAADAQNEMAKAVEGNSRNITALNTAFGTLTGTLISADGGLSELLATLVDASIAMHPITRDILLWAAALEDVTEKVESLESAFSAAWPSVMTFAGAINAASSRDATAEMAALAEEYVRIARAARAAAAAEKEREATYKAGRPAPVIDRMGGDYGDTSPAPEDLLVDVFGPSGDSAENIDNTGKSLRELDADIQQHLANARLLGEVYTANTAIVAEAADMSIQIVGDSVSNIIGDTLNGILQLQSGPIMIGRAFKQMGAMVISELSRIIGRMIAMKALMALFNFVVPGSGSFVAQSFGGFSAHGRRVPSAATGYSVPGMAGLDALPMIMPGTPGLDRTMVMAHGGEMLIPQARVNAAEKMLNRSLTSPRRDRRGPGRRRPPMEMQIVRPFRTEEAVRLNDSINDGASRAARYGG